MLLLRAWRARHRSGSSGRSTGDLVEGSLDRGDLGDDVGAVALLVDHPPTVEGLPEARPAEVVELAAGDEFD
jgi:hypothetical protein